MTTRPYRPSRRTALGLIGAAFAVPGAAFAGSLEVLSGTAFGTSWRMVAPSGSGVAQLKPRIDALFAAVDRQLSPWRSDSAISLFNAGPAGAQATDPAVVEVTIAALEIASQSQGAFDPTVGPLVARWGFGPIDGGGAPDWRALSVGPRDVSKARADLTLDLCGIAKGWALDKAAALTRDAGFDDFLFELGGEFIARGQHPEGRAWRVAVEAPLSAPPALHLPAGAAVATSGVQAQSYTRNGRTYSHIIDPAAQAPAAGKLRSVTVVAQTAMIADGWATALCAAGDAAGPDLARTHDIAALFLIEAPSGMRQVQTGAIMDLIL